MVAVEILGVQEGINNHPMVLLRHEDRVLPIVVGLNEANAIVMGINNEKVGRPMTHDLVCNLLAGLGGVLESVTIYKLENDTFFAHLNVERKSEDGVVEQILRIDARPSDGVAVAVRIGCPIYVADDVMNTASQDLANLNPEDESEGEDDPDS